MATRPTPGGDANTWGTKLNTHLAVSLAADGKINDGAAQSTSAAPTADAELANKKYVDDAIAAAGVPKIKVGEYAGDSTNPHAITGVGFQPDVVHIWQESKHAWTSFVDLDDGDAHRSELGTANNLYQDVMDFGADGFTLKSTDIIVNQTGKGYHYIAIKES